MNCCRRRECLWGLVRAAASRQRHDAIGYYQRRGGSENLAPHVRASCIGEMQWRSMRVLRLAACE